MPFLIFLQKSSGVVSVMLGGFLAYQLALLSWSLLPEQESKYQWIVPKVKTTTHDNQVNTIKLQQQHLFGNSSKGNTSGEKKAPVSNLPKTKLNLILAGVVAASEPRFSSAIISNKGEQGSYFVDSKIEGTDASVSEIYEDRVILDVNGILETLFLDGADNSKTANNSRTTTRTKKRNVKSVEVDIDREELLSNPSKLTDYVRITPYRKDGEVLGYRLKPGKNRELFEQAGFEKNDLAIELNGVDLTDTEQAFSLMKEFSTMTEINVTVERNGELHQLSLNTL